MNEEEAPQAPSIERLMMIVAGKEYDLSMYRERNAALTQQVALQQAEIERLGLLVPPPAGEPTE